MADIAVPIVDLPIPVGDLQCSNGELLCKTGIIIELAFMMEETMISKKAAETLGFTIIDYVGKISAPTSAKKDLNACGIVPRVKFSYQGKVTFQKLFVINAGDKVTLGGGEIKDLGLVGLEPMESRKFQASISTV